MSCALGGTHDRKRERFIPVIAGEVIVLTLCSHNAVNSDNRRTMPDNSGDDTSHSYAVIYCGQDALVKFVVDEEAE